MAVAGCGNKCIKYLLLIFNLIFFILGLVLVGLCVWAIVEDDGSSSTLEDAASMMDLDDVLQLLDKKIIYAVLIFACIIILISFLGCCGAWREVKACLVIYFVLVLIIALALFIGAILLFVYKREIKEEARIKLKKSLTNEYSGRGMEKVTQAWDLLQTKLKCCGIDSKNSTDDYWYIWQNSIWFSAMTGQEPSNIRYVPDSCCVREDNELDSPIVDDRKCTGLDQADVPVEDVKMPPKANPGTSGLEDNSALNSEGCFDRVESKVKSQAVVIGIIAIVTALVMLLAMIFAICLCQAIV